MSKLIPAHVREQQINARPNISFVRWVDEYRNNKSKAICRCKMDGYEWSVCSSDLINGGRGCPQCGGRRCWTAVERIAQINERINISFVRWVGVYRDSDSRALVRCALDGYEWAPSIHSLINHGVGCPHCGGSRRWTAEERIAQINARPNIRFLHWIGDYAGAGTKAMCRCAIDGYEWPAKVDDLINKGNGCPQCGGTLKRTSSECISVINARPDISFVRWDSVYRNSASKAVVRCAIDGYEWSTRVNALINKGSGCPQCAKSGYDPSEHGTLYALRSECGTMVKIGISNNYKRRHTQLKRATPFDWHCIELLHSDDGSLIAELEKELHSWTAPVEFSEPFDGYTEWRKWDDRLPRWVKRYRARLARYNKAP